MPTVALHRARARYSELPRRAGALQVAISRPGACPLVPLGRPCVLPRTIAMNLPIYPTSNLLLKALICRCLPLPRLHHPKTGRFEGDFSREGCLQEVACPGRRHRGVLSLRVRPHPHHTAQWPLNLLHFTHLWIPPPCGSLGVHLCITIPGESTFISRVVQRIIDILAISVLFWRLRSRWVSILFCMSVGFGWCWC